MKISTITCNNALNYGARLQAFALQHYLESLGHEVEVIDYEPDYVQFNTRVLYNPGLNPKEWLKLPLRIRQRSLDVSKHKALEAFSEKYLHLTRKYRSADDLQKNPPHADVYIAGSDQIWNTDLKNGHDKAFFLDFGDSGTRRISYAASFAIKSIPNDVKPAVENGLKNFDAITVREESALRILNRFGMQGSVVCDPVFLLPADFWTGFADDTGKGEKYLLVYDFEGSDELKQVALRLAKKRSLRIFSVSPHPFRYADRNFSACSPETFVALFKNASCVVCNSLHGSVFSMIFQKDFFVVNRADGLNTRMAELLKRYGLENRVIAPSDLAKCDFLPIDFSRQTLQKDIHESKRILNRMLDGDEAEPDLNSFSKGSFKGLCDIADCTGCGACEAVCGVEAVRMEKDAFGFPYPATDPEKCVECGACAAVCPEAIPIPLSKPIKTMALQIADAEVRNLSSSGGAASLITKAFIDAGGVVYACVQDDFSNIYHKRIETEADLNAMRGSKYVQSDLRHVFKECKTDLYAGKKVLFIGTPCQVAGVKLYMRGKDENLFTADLVCHGVPSQQFLQDDISCLDVEVPTEANVAFRRKVSGKTRFGMYLDYKGDRLYARDYPDDYFISAFLRGNLFRQNCFDCRYATDKRVSDITLGDFWGLGKEKPSEMSPEAGVSLILVNTVKGKDLAPANMNGVIIEVRSLDEAVNGNTQLRKAFRMPADYDDFRKSYLEHGYRQTCEKFLSRYIKRNRLSMKIERHPYLCIPLRIYLKLCH